jgi:hypothetical protein
MAVRMRFYHACVDWPEHDVDTDDGLIAMIDQAREITRRTFLRHIDPVDLANLSSDLGYDHAADWRLGGLTMANDWHISYHRSKLHGKRVYYFRHSAIEYVFTGPKP